MSSFPNQSNPPSTFEFCRVQGYIMSRFLVFPTVLVILVGLVASDQCPPITLTRPCVCETAGKVASLTCENIKSKDVLEGVFRRTGRTQFRNFHVAHSEIASIPVSKSLVSKRFNAISVTDSKLTTLFDSVLDSSNVITMLRLENVVFQGQFPWSQLQNLKTLKYLNILGVDVPSLDDGFKNNVNKGLKLLMMHNTKTSRLVEGVFSQFNSLNDLRIEQAQLKEIKRSYFPRPSALGYLGLDGNQIRSLPNDIFADMPSLLIVSLRRNKLSVVSETVFGGVFNQLITLSLNGNPIECGCSMRWITSKQKPRELDGRCSSPENLKNKKLAELQSNDFTSCE